MARIAVSIVLLAAACSLPDVEPMTGETPPPTSASPLVTPWRATSRRIEIFSSEVGIRDALYVKDRDELTSEQLDALAQMRLFTPLRSPYIDAQYHFIRVTDDDGTVATYSSDSSRGLIPAPRNGAPYAGSVDAESLKAFLATIRRCRLRSEAWQRRLSASPIPPGDAAVSVASSLSLDSGCRSSVYLREECGDLLLTFDVPARATYEIAVDRCVGVMALRAYASTRTSASDASALVAESPSGTSGECGMLRHTFDPGSYVIAIAKTNPSGFCPLSLERGDDRSQVTGGRIRLRVRALP